MEKIFNRIKLSLATLWVSIISFFSKVMGQSYGEALYWVQRPYDDMIMQPAYWVPNTMSPVKPTLIDILIKISNGIIRLILVPVLLIVGIINIKKIWKISDKVERKKKIKRTIITLLLILIWTVILFVLLRLLVRFLLKNDSTY